MHTERLARLAQGQLGLFTRHQALAVGASAKVVDGGLAAGRWQRVHRNVYRMAGAPGSDLQPLLAAVLAAGPGAVASHRAAAWLWELADEPELEVTVTKSGSARLPDVCVHRCSWIPPPSPGGAASP